jgi:hypothetical protein
MRTATRLLLLLCATATAGEPPADPPARETLSFVIFGDRTSGRSDGVRVLEAAVRATNELDPDFTINVGDMVQGYNEGARWLAEMREYKAVMAELRRPWYPVAGNHDVYGRGKDRAKGHVALYREHFAPLWYSFDYKWAHFVVLFSDESLSFRDPAKTQNMSPEQLAWLARDLKETDAEQVYCFLHHPRWTYRGTNWPKVHEVLRSDGRVRAVFAGHIHVYRDDGVRDGIHYFTLAVTGGVASGLKTPAALHHLNHVRVTREGFTMSVLPAGAVVGANLVYGEEVDRLHALRRGGWIGVDGAAVQQAGIASESAVKVLVRNPAETPVAFEAKLDVPRGWVAEPARFGGQIAAGAEKLETVRLIAPPFTGVEPALRVRVTLHHPLKSGLIQPVHHAQRMRARIMGLPSAAAEPNAALVLDGKSAVRVDMPVDTEEFTLECWARGAEPAGSQSLVSKTEGSAFGLWWCYGDRKLPYGVVGFKKGGYRNATAPAGWDWARWTHLALTCGGGKVRLFVDGKLQAENTGEGERSRNDRHLYIGADPDRGNRPSHFFRGAIDEVRLSRGVRYAKDFEPKRVFARDEATLLLLHFDGRVNGVFPDDSGHDHHAFPVGKPKLAEAER